MAAAGDDFAAGHGEREHIVERPVECDRCKQCTDAPADETGNHALGVDLQDSLVFLAQVFIVGRQPGPIER